MVNFVKGDKLLCIRGQEVHGLQEGQVYIFEEYGEDKDLLYIENYGLQFFSNRFRKVEMKAAVNKDPVAIAKGGDVVIPRKFIGAFQEGGERNPGWIDDMLELLDKPIVAMGLEDAYPNYVPMLKVGKYFWPIDALDVVKDGKVIKAAKKMVKKKPKVKKPRKVVLRTRLNKEAQGNTCCSYGHEFEDGTFNMQSNDACHARLQAGAKERKLVSLALHFTKYMEKRGAEQTKLWIKYYNYMANRSPAAHCFKTKKGSEALSRGILMNVQATAENIGFACVALRQTTERPGLLNAYAWALKNKASEHAAWLFSFTHHLSAGGRWSHLLTGGHQCLTPSLEFDKMINAFKDGLYPGNAPQPMATGGYYKVSPSWYKGAYGENWAEANNTNIKTLAGRLDSFAKVGAGGFGAQIVMDDAWALKRLKGIDAAIKGVLK